MNNLIRLKYAGTCADCGASLPVGAQARYYGRGRVYGVTCHPRARAERPLVDRAMRAAVKTRTYNLGVTLLCANAYRTAYDLDTYATYVERFAINSWKLRAREGIHHGRDFCESCTIGEPCKLAVRIANLPGEISRIRRMTLAQLQAAGRADIARRYVERADSLPIYLNRNPSAWITATYDGEPPSGKARQARERVLEAMRLTMSGPGWSREVAA